jgi:hypothetical protein
MTCATLLYLPVVTCKSFFAKKPTMGLKKPETPTPAKGKDGLIRPHSPLAAEIERSR